MAFAEIDWDDEFLSAAMDPTLWVSALEKLAGATASNAAQLIGIGASREVPFNLVTNIDVGALEEFIAIDGGAPDVNFRVRAGMEAPVMALVTEQDYDRVRPTLASSKYLDYCSKHDIWNGCQTVLVGDHAGLVGMALLRSERDGRTSLDQQAVFARAAKAAKRAIGLQERLEGQQAALLAGALDTVNIAAFLLGARGRLLAMTELAERHVSSGAIRISGASLDGDSRPQSLARAISELLYRDNRAPLRVHMERGPGVSPLILEGYRLPQQQWTLGRQPEAILIVKSVKASAPSLSAFVSAIYRLTAAEADIALRLFRGESRSEISEARSISGETLKTQIKTIYVKMGVHSEAALIRLMASIAA